MDNNKISFLEKYNISPVLFASLSLLFILFLYHFLGSIFIFFVLGDNLKSLDPFNLRIASSIGQLFFLLLPTLLLKKLTPDTYKNIFKLNPISLKLIFYIIINVLAIMEIAQILILLQSQIPFPNEIRDLIYQFKKSIEDTYRILIQSQSIGEFLFVVFVIAIIPAFSEELLFRGLIQSYFIKGLGVKKGIVITGLFFAVFHFNPFAFLGLLLLGIYFCFLVYKTNSVYSSIIGHFSNNFLATLSIFLLGKEDIILNNNNEVILASELPTIFFVFILSLIIFIFSLYLIYKETDKQNK